MSVENPAAVSQPAEPMTGKTRLWPRLNQQAAVIPHHSDICGRSAYWPRSQTCTSNRLLCRSGLFTSHPSLTVVEDSTPKQRWTIWKSIHAVMQLGQTRQWADVRAWPWIYTYEESESICILLGQIFFSCSHARLELLSVRGLPLTFSHFPPPYHHYKPLTWNKTNFNLSPITMFEP